MFIGSSEVDFNLGPLRAKEAPSAEIFCSYIFLCYNI